MAAETINLAGTRFGKLVVLRRDDAARKNYYYAHWLCQCDCGNQKVVSSHSLRHGATRSCGCLIRMGAYARKTHGETIGRKPSHEYKTWGGMKERCLNRDSKDFPKYGGRGIKCCDAWQASFSQFLSDMGRAPSCDHSIDRIDVNGNYEPGNCRWATRTVQQRNRRCNRQVTALGRTQTVAGWAEEIGVSYITLLSRFRNGWNPDDAVTRPINSNLCRVAGRNK